MKKINVIDLFAGCGGLSEGFMQTDKYNFIAHVEWEKPMVETLRNNLVKRWGYTSEEARKNVIHFDIQKVDELLFGNWTEESKEMYSKNNYDLLEKVGLNGIINGQKIDVIIGGPPCQSYSIAGRANSKKNDYRNYLFESFVKIVDHFKPKIFVFENVPGILSAKVDNENIVNKIYGAFNDIGYTIMEPSRMKEAVFTSLDFETPQDRKRVIIYGVNKEYKKEVDSLYNALEHLKSSRKNITVREAIGKLPKFYPLEQSTKQNGRNVSHELVGKKTVINHDARYHNIRDINIFKEWIEKDLNSYSLDEKKIFYKEKTGKDTNHNKYRNLEWDKPSPTIVAHLKKDGLLFIHPDKDQARSITVKEAALLQTFPEDFEFIFSDALNFKMIGNAVPVNFAKKIGESIIEILQKDFAKQISEKEKSSKRKLNVLVACEESQRVCIEFRKLGHNAFSCDLLKSSGGHPEWHFKEDVFKIIQNKGGTLEIGTEEYIDGEWDLMIAHPPCTFLSVSGARWYYHPDDNDLSIEKRRPHPRFPNRMKDREEAAEFFMKLVNTDIKHVAIENPVGIMSTRYRKPDQTVQPYWFGDSFSKATCLWLKNLSPLEPTNMVDRGEFVELKSGRRLPKWYSDALTKAKTPEERRTLRSKTFPGFAKALAEQWSKEILDDKNLY